MSPYLFIYFLSWQGKGKNEKDTEKISHYLSKEYFKSIRQVVKKLEALCKRGRSLWFGFLKAIRLDDACRQTKTQR